MTGKTLKDLKCRCGHDKPQHQRVDNTTEYTWCNGDCGCSYFEPLNEPDPPYAPTLVGPLPTWINAITDNTAIASFIQAISSRVERPPNG